MRNLRQLALFHAAALALLAGGVPVSAKIVSGAAMVSHCAEAAATELGAIMTEVLTLPFERRGGKSHIYGQYPDSGPHLTLLECQHDSKRTFPNISIDGHHGHQTEAAGSAPRAAQRTCTDMMGRPVQIETGSPLRPGYHEIILTEVDGPRRVACTVGDDGTLEDWVEMT